MLGGRGKRSKKANQTRMGGGGKRKQERDRGLVCKLGEDGHGKASWVRMGMAMVSSTASAAPAAMLERLGLERRDGVDGMGLSLLVPDDTYDPTPPMPALLPGPFLLCC